MELKQCRPKPFELPKGRTALVMIDMQRDFVMKGGYGYLQCNSEEVFKQASNIIEPCVKVLNAARKLGMTVIHTREGHVPDLRDLAPSKKTRQYSAKPENYTLLIGDKGPMGRLLVRGEYGHDIIDELKPLPTEVVVDKPGKGTFYNTDIHQVLVTRGITHLLICGVTTECCVGTTFREANDHGFECCALADCTNGFDEDLVRGSLNSLCSYDGLLGYVGSGEELTALVSESTQESLKIQLQAESFLNKISTTEKGALYPTEFKIHESVSDESNLTKSIISKGGKLSGSTSDLELGSGSFMVAVNDGTLESTYPIFTPSAGMISLHMTNHTMFGSVSIISKTLEEARHVFANERGFDEEDELSKPYYEFPIKPIDFRGIENHFRFAAIDDELGSKFGERGTPVPFDWNLFNSIYNHSDLLEAELASVKKLDKEVLVKSRYIEILSKRKQILNLFQPVNAPHVLICRESSKIKYIVRLLGFPSVTVNGIIFIAEFGLDGLLLDICQSI